MLCRSVLDCWYLWCRQQRCWDEQLGPLQEVFVLRKAFYLSETKVDCAHVLYGPMHKTCMQAYDLCLFFLWRMEAMLTCNVLLELVEDRVTCSLHQLCSDVYLTRSR